jgi:hypothetical protein
VTWFLRVLLSQAVLAVAVLMVLMAESVVVVAVVAVEF